MRLTRFDRLDRFLVSARPFLMAREAEHNLMLGIAGSLQADPNRYEGPPYLATVEDGGATVAVAMRTPPHNALLSGMETVAPVALIAGDMHAAYGVLPGASGPKQVVAAFVREWQARTGQSFRLTMPQRIYKLERSVPPEGVPGHLRPATPDDRPLLLSWFRAFTWEAVGTNEDPAPDVDRFLRFVTGGMYIWEDGQPASMAAWSSPTANGVRIAAVYTPPELRRRGYASACVAALSQLMLDQGRRFCFLYTDLNNPTPNRIYPRIGYVPVCDVDQYEFA
jgi:hypothetical protein